MTDTRTDVRTEWREERCTECGALRDVEYRTWRDGRGRRCARRTGWAGLCDCDAS